MHKNNIEFSSYLEGLEKLGEAVERARNNEIPPATVGDYFEIATSKVLAYVKSAPDRAAAREFSNALHAQETNKPLTLRQIGCLANNGVPVRFNPLKPIL